MRWWTARFSLCTVKKLTCFPAQWTLLREENRQQFAHDIRNERSLMDPSTPTSNQTAWPAPTKLAAGVGLLLLVAGAYGLGWYHRNHRYDGLAQCMAAKQVKMYGAYWCSHCADRSEILGRPYRFVYEECGVPGS